MANYFFVVFEQSKWLAKKLKEDIEENRFTEAESIAVEKGFKEIENGKTIRIKNIHNIWESIS